MQKNPDKVKGALYGVAAGDALGGPLEFMSADEIQYRHGYVQTMLGGGWLSLRPGEVTDDTQMTLAVAEGVVRYGKKKAISEEDVKEIIHLIGEEFFEWAAGKPKDIGITCERAISLARQHIRFGGFDAYTAWMKSAELYHRQSGGRSAGNGTLMRTIFPALYYDDLDSAVLISRMQSKMTHFDDTAADCCEAYTRMVYDALSMDSAQALAMVRQRTEQLSSTLLPVLKNAAIAPDGYVIHSFAAALASICSANSLREAVCSAVNRGGDADTIGAIASGLAGAIWGYDEIPAEWKAAFSEDLTQKLDLYVSLAVR